MEFRMKRTEGHTNPLAVKCACDHCRKVRASHLGNPDIPEWALEPFDLDGFCAAIEGKDGPVTWKGEP